MKFKTIFGISIAIGMLQLVPLIGSLISADFKQSLLQEVFKNPPSVESVAVFQVFIVVTGLGYLGYLFMMIGALSFKDLDVLRRLSFLFFVGSGFWLLPDLFNAIAGAGTAPLPVIILNLIQIGLLFYGSRKGTI